MTKIVSWFHSWIYGGVWATVSPTKSYTESKSGAWAHIKAFVMADIYEKPSIVIATFTEEASGIEEGDAWAFQTKE